MNMIIKEVYTKSILSASKIYHYVINPYVGCQFGCSYCYARFMKRLIDNDWPIRIQTKSHLVLRDIDVIKHSNNCEVGLSITTTDDEIRKLFEPEAPAIMDRIKALKQLHNSGIRTYAMIAPILPRSEKIMDLLEGKVDYIYVDRMNYHHANFI